MAHSADLNARIEGSRYNRFFIELLRNSGYFAMVNILLESLLESPLAYIREPDLYAMVFAVLLQSYWLSRWQRGPEFRRFFGNLIGPASYSLIEMAVEGAKFLDAPHHMAYWVFSLLIGGIQHLRWEYPLPPTVQGVLLIAENMVRSLIVFVMYMILEHSQAGSDYSSLRLFMTDSTHLFLFLTTLFLGIGVGIAEVISGRYLSLLKETSWQLKIYSEWFFGKHLFQQVISDPEAIQLDSKQRVVLFMDIRGFTAWSERHTPQRVVTLLSRYFTTAETICNHYLAIKVKFTGDEVMAVFRSERDALGAAHALRNSMGAAFKRQGMAIGIGINKGLLMEGIIGAESIKYYDVIGDVVNTAKRIESQADGNDILVSANVVASCRSDKVRFGPPMQLELKGKAQSVTVHALQSLG